MTLAVYETTRTFPRDELYGLTSQLRRSAASIGAKSLKGAVVDQMEKWLAFFRSRVDLLVKSSITFCWLETSSIFVKSSSVSCRVRPMNCRGC